MVQTIKINLTRGLTHLLSAFDSRVFESTVFEASGLSGEAVSIVPATQGGFVGKTSVIRRLKLPFVVVHYCRNLAKEM